MMLSFKPLIANCAPFLLSVILIVLVTPQSLARPWDLSFDLKAEYDDNVLNYSDADLELLDDQTAPPSKFGITSKSDYIITPGIEVVYKTFLAGHSLHLGLDGSYSYYKRNDVKRYFKAGGFARRYLRKGAYIQVSLTYLPDYYYRNLYGTGVGYVEATFNKAIGELKVGVELSPSLTGNLHYSYSNKDFVPLFDERDIVTHEFAAEGIFRPQKLWKAWGSLGFTTGKSAGADNSEFRRDTSYDSFTSHLGLRLYLRGLKRQSLELAAWATDDLIYYQTAKLTAEDRYRLGRRDNRLSATVSAEHSITSRLNGVVVLNRITKDVDLPATDLIRYLEFTSTSLGVSVQYRY